jgi:electron transfer flavoprotein alpha subunit
MAGVLAFGDAPGGVLTESSFEVATAARELALAIEEPVAGGLIGSGIGRAANEMLAGGASMLFVVDDSRLEPYSGELYAAAAAAILREFQPSIVLAPHTLDTREWLPLLAAAEDAALVTDCVRLAVDRGHVLMTRPIYGGSAMAEYAAATLVAMATLRPGSWDAEQVVATGSIVPLTLPAMTPRVTMLEQVADVVPEGPRLKDAAVVVSGGLGVGGPDNWHLIEETASVLGGAVGATRAVTDLGWVPGHHQVGLTGSTVAPDLYIAIGVSGAIQHMAGISRASTIVAINRDRDANIFSVARFGAVGDAKEIVPAFVARLRQLRS